jgi:hypothetical protein
MFSGIVESRDVRLCEWKIAGALAGSIRAWHSGRAATGDITRKYLEPRVYLGREARMRREKTRRASARSPVDGRNVEGAREAAQSRKIGRPYNISVVVLAR